MSCDCVARVKNSSKYDYWYHTLLQFGLHADLGRFRGVARFFTRNEFSLRSHLKHAPHPSKWPGARQLTDIELEVVCRVWRSPWQCQGECSMTASKRKRFALCACSLRHVCFLLEHLGGRPPVEDVVEVFKRPLREQHPPVAGPRAALLDLRAINQDPESWARWAEEARLRAILGTCQRSLPSVLSGVRCYIAFKGVSQLVLFSRFCSHGGPGRVLQMPCAAAKRSISPRKLTRSSCGLRRFGAVVHFRITAAACGQLVW